MKVRNRGGARALLGTRAPLKRVAALTLAAVGCGDSGGLEGRAVGDGGQTNVDEMAGEGPIRTRLAFTGTCAFAGTTATITVNSGDSIVIAKRLSDGAITVNDTPCSTATSTNTKTINVAEAGAAGPENVVVDYLNGVFAPGSATSGQGIFLNYGTDAADKFSFRMTSAIDTVKVGAGGINVNGDAYKDIVFTAVPLVVTASLGAGNDVFSGAGDATTGAAFPNPLSVYGGDGNDSLRGGNGADFLYGDAGDDTLDAEAAPAGGSDTFDGGAGSDTVTYVARTNPVTVTIGDGANDGETGENDSILETVEIVVGGAGNDTLSGSLDATQTKTLNGGPGDDTFLQRTAGAADSHDTLIGGAGTDTVDYSVRTLAITATMDGVAANDGVSAEADNIMADVENIKTGAGDDNITGNALNNKIAAGAGNNTLNGGAGDDVFDQGLNAANTGMDTIDGGAGTDTVDYSARTNPLVVVMDGVTASGDTAHSEADIIKTTVENVYGGSGADSITGNAFNNTLLGNGGDDTITGLDGDDVCNGGTTGETNGDTIDCGNGSDISIDGETVNANCEIKL